MNTITTPTTDTLHDQTACVNELLLLGLGCVLWSD